MRIEHRGFKVAEMVGDIWAEVNDDGSYTEVVVKGFGPVRSFDLNGLESFIAELVAVRDLAQQVERANDMSREGGS